MQQKFHSILFSTPMVQAILDGRKTMTRRVVENRYSALDKEWKPTIVKEEHFDGIDRWEWRNGTRYLLPTFKCPYGKPGDTLWVKESYYSYGFWTKNGQTKTGKQKWSFIDDAAYTSIAYNDRPPYQVEKNSNREVGWYKRLGRFMPKKACRLFLRIKSVRVERLQEISESDAKSEGASPTAYGKYKPGFEIIWQSINGADSWDANPWVWVITFERIEKPELFLTSNTNQNGRKKSTRKTQLVGVPTQTGR